MVEIKETSYKDERLGFFADQRKLVQKRYDRLEKQIKPDEPYTSERREFLGDLGRELSFYNDVIEMLENGVVPKSEFDKLQEQFSILDAECDRMERAESKHYDDIIKAKAEFANQIFEDIFLNSYYENGKLVVSHDDIVKIKNKHQRRLNL